MDEPRRIGCISVIVPVYNVQKYLNRCVGSIVGQSYQLLEIILVDDGSEDDSAQICDEWEKKDTRVRVIHTENRGTASARNLGLEISTGEFIMFVDSDDFISASICEILLTQLKKYHSECCLCGYQMISDRGYEGKERSNTVFSLTGKEAINRRYINGEGYINIINPWGKLFHWSMWKNLRFTPGIYYEDLDVMPSLYYNCNKITVIPDVGYYYFIRVGSCSNGVGTDEKRYIDSLRIRKKHMLFFKERMENNLALIIEQKMVELIITSDCNNWIPQEYKKESKELFLFCWKNMLNNEKINKKDKLRYCIYRFGGVILYNILLGLKDNFFN